MKKIWFLFLCLWLGLVGQAKAKDTIHQVIEGDIVGRLALCYGVTQSAIKEANDLADVDRIRIGQKLIMPNPKLSCNNVKIPAVKSQKILKSKKKQFPGVKTKKHEELVTVKVVKEKETVRHMSALPPGVAQAVPMTKEELASAKKQHSAKNQDSHDSWDANIGGGWYGSASDEEDGKGNYVYVETRIRPFSFVDDSTTYSAGVFAQILRSEGNEGDYSYETPYRFLIGPTVHVNHGDWTLDVDVAWGWINNEGSERLYNSEQDDEVLMTRAYLTIHDLFLEPGSAWFNQTVIGASYLHPLSADQEHSWNGESLEPDPWDNEFLEFSLTQSIVDFAVSDELTITPNFNFSFGREFGREQNFFKIGPGFTFTYEDQDIFECSFLNYREMLGGDGDQWTWFSFNWNLDGTYRAYKASQVSAATKEYKQQRYSRSPLAKLKNKTAEPERGVTDNILFEEEFHR